MKLQGLRARVCLSGPPLPQVSGQEFDEFLRNPDKGTKMKPALHRNFSKSRTALGIFNTQAGKGLGADGVTPPWARPVLPPLRASLFAASTLNATGQSRVTLSLR